MQSLPPLKALRTFEASARHLSFTEAAKELHVSQAAVSYQIRSLEQHLGVVLFHRFTRRIALTDEGAALLPVLTDAFSRIAEVTERIRPGRGQLVLTISLTPSVSAKWLVQRLGRFRQQHPDIELRLHHAFHYVDFAREAIDVAIRFGRGMWSDLCAEFLLPASLVPICSPKLYEGRKPLRKLADLRHYTLLHENGYETWARWLAAAGLRDIDVRRGPVIDEPSALIQTAIEGEGVAICRTALVCDDLAAGRLVRPFALSLEADTAYYVVCPPQLRDTPKVSAFRDFVLSEAADSLKAAIPERR